MSKRSIGLVISVLCFIIGLVGLTGCEFEFEYETASVSTKDKEPEPEKNVFYEYCVYTGDTVFADAEVDKHYIPKLPEVVDRSWQKVEGFDLEIKSVEDKNGKKVDVSGGRLFTPSELGVYTITFYCPDNELVKEGSVEINCIDTTGPKIDTSMVNSFVFSESGFDIPNFKATDKGGIDEDSKAVKLFDENNAEIVPVNGRYENVSEGNYLYEFSVKDVSGNESVATKDIYVTGQAMTEGKLTYLSQNDYSQQVFKYGSSSLPNMEWSSATKDPNGNETLQLSSATSNSSGFMVCFSCAISDWTPYDYWSMWVYNPTSEYLAAMLIGSSEDSYSLTPNGWTYLCRSVNDFFQDNNGVSHMRNEYTRVALYIYDRFTKDNSEKPYLLNTDEKFYVSNIYLHKDETGNIYSIGEEFGMKNVSVHQKFMDYGYAYSEEHKFADDDNPGAAKFTFSEKTIHSFNVSFAGASKYLNVDNPRYLFNVYNPNDYDIVIIDNSCDNATARGVNCSGNYSTIVRAKSEAKVLVQIDLEKKYCYLMAVKTDGSYVDKDFVIYFGNVRQSDNFEGDYNTWNETNGIVDIWQKYLDKKGA